MKHYLCYLTTHRASRVLVAPLLICAVLGGAQGQAESSPGVIETNAVHMTGSPSWLKRTRVEKVTDRIQTKLEWTIRKIQVKWYDTPESYAQVNKLNSAVVAFARQTDNTIHIGPDVTDSNFDQIFGHELVHIITYQKYKDAIPKWLDEGLANYLSKSGPVKYKWLSEQKLPEDVTQMGHPFKGSSVDFRVNYAVSQALIEMIAAKCDLSQLIQLSVEKHLEDYLKTYCEIEDLNGAFKKWIKKKSS
jgi:hypothetical protein